MSAIGAVGGRVSRSGRVDRGLSVELRQQAREEPQRLLNSDDERVRLQAARSIGAYSPEPAPRIDQAQGQQASGAKTVTLSTIVLTAAESAVFSASGRLSRDAEAEIAERIRGAVVGGEGRQAHHPPP